MPRPSHSAAALLLLLCLGNIHCKTPDASDDPRSTTAAARPLESTAAASTNTNALQRPPPDPPLREIRPGIFQFGEITIDRARRSVTFPAVVNLDRGAMEYFLVTTWGKTHESILRTEIEPHRVHTAMLLLGAKGAGTNAESALESFDGFISQPSSARLPGDAVEIEIQWTVDGREVRRPAEELVFNEETRAALGKGAWVYNGSLTIDSTFLADWTGSIISLITDPRALINNIGLGHDNQAIWSANTNAVPPADLPVEVTFTLSARKP